MKQGKPTFEEIKELVTKCETIYGELFSKFEEDQRFYELDFKKELNLPTEFKSDGIVLPSARDFVDVFTDHIDISNARVFVNRKGTSTLSAEQVEMMRKFYLGLIHRTKVESDISPWRVGAKYYALHGLTIFKTVWDADLWPDKPEQKDGESENDYAVRIDEWRAETRLTLPIVIQAINPRCVMPDPSYGGRQFVIEKHEDIVLNITNRWPKWSNPQSKNKSDKVDLVSWWNKHYRCDYVDDEPVLRTSGGVAKHNYGFIPYVFIDAGLGNISYDAKPEMRYVGILRYIYSLLISESLNYSLNNILMKRETMKGGYITGADSNAVSEVKQEYGKYWPVGDKDVVFHDWESKLAPQAAYGHLDLTSSILSAHAAPRVLRGLSEQGVRSGAERRLMLSEASSRFRYSEDAFRNGTAKVLNNCALLFKNVIPGDIRVWARTPTDEFDVEVKKDEMKEPFTCYVEFAPISEEDEYRRHDDLIRQVGAGLLTRQTARRQLSNIDPIAMDKEERKEILRQSPAYQQVLSGFLAAKAQAELGTLQPPPPITQGGIQGGEQPLIPEGSRMQPPIRQVPIPGSAEDIQARLKTLRSQTSPSATQGRGGGGS